MADENLSKMNAAFSGWLFDQDGTSYFIPKDVKELPRAVTGFRQPVDKATADRLRQLSAVAISNDLAVVMAEFLEKKY